MISSKCSIVLNACRGTDRDRHFGLVIPVLRPNTLLEEARIAHHGIIKLERRHVTTLYLLTNERPLGGRDASGEIDDDPKEMLTRRTGSGSSGIVSNPIMQSKVL